MPFKMCAVLSLVINKNIGLSKFETNQEIIGSFVIPKKSRNNWHYTIVMTAEGMFYVLAFRVAKMCQKLRPYANSCSRIGKCIEFSENEPNVDKVCWKVKMF